MDKDRLVFPPVPATGFALAIIFVYTSLFPKAMAQSMLAGTAMGYVIYDLLHYYLHHGSPSVYYFKNLKNYHVKHHYVDQQKGRVYTLVCVIVWVIWVVYVVVYRYL